MTTVQPDLNKFLSYLELWGFGLEELMGMRPEEMRDWMSLYVTEHWLASIENTGMDIHQKENFVTKLTKEFWNGIFDNMKKRYKEMKRNERANQNRGIN